MAKFTVLVLLALADKRGSRTPQIISSVRVIYVILLRAVKSLTTHVILPTE